MLSRDISRILGANRTELGMLGGSLLSATKGKLPKTILVTSARRREGRTTTAVALAHALATESNACVLLVDADMHSPSLHNCVGLEQEPGLSGCINGGDDHGVSESGIDRLTVMPAGADPENTARFLASEGIVNVLEEWPQQYEHIILDTSSVLSTSTPTLLAPHVDGVLLVAECERTKWQVLEAAQEKLVGAGGCVLGVILNKRRYYIPKLLYGSV